MRISGLASGMDIDSLVEKLMTAERVPLDKLEQQKQIYEWQRDSYRDVNKKLTTFDNYIADNFILKSLNAKTATTSNSNLVEATATGSASGTLSIEGVKQLATAARKVGSMVKEEGGKIATGSTKISELDSNSNTKFTGTEEYSILLKSINASGKLATEATEIKFKASDTIDDVISKINSSKSGVVAFFEKGQLSLTAANTGQLEGNDAEIQLVDSQDSTDGQTINGTGNALFSLLGVGESNSNKLVDGGTNAIFSVNGIETVRSSNRFTLNGYSITLKDTFNTTFDETAGKSVTLTAATNVDEIVDKIKEFVKTYNGFITDLKSLTTETKYRDYKPLTTAQRKEMEDKEVELWEGKAKSGLLRNDSIISSGLSSMRSLIYQSNPAVSNPKYNTLYNIGITTSKDYTAGGTLEIDESKLRAALEADPDSVVQLLTGAGEQDATVTVNGETKQADTRGFLRKIRTEMDVIEKKIDERAGRGSMNETQYTLGKNLRDVTKRIEAWEDKLTAKETRYWTQFSAMESMINKANNQSSMLTNQFS